MSILYNEIEPFAAAWLRNLSAADLIAPGVVDERSIVDLRPSDLAGVVQAHFFAGIGGWSYALRLAGWPDDLEVWTGSAPCQPFSSAGRQRGFEDERHLWPAWFDLIRERTPHAIFGEQVSSPAGLAWFDAVRADLEGAGYAVGVLDTCAASAGAPHIRQRLFFGAVRVGVGLADPDASGRSEQWRRRLRNLAVASQRHDADGRGSERAAGVALGDSGSKRSGRDAGAVPRAEGEGASERFDARRLADEPLAASAGDCAVGNAERRGSGEVGTSKARGDAPREPQRSGSIGPWDDVVWLPCSDGKRRPTQPGLEPLAARFPGIVGRRRAYGNAICVQVAAEFIRSFIEAATDETKDGGDDDRR